MRTRPAHISALPPHAVWVIILAGGEGRRLEAVSRARYGYPRPKQFCDYGDGATLLHKTILRARRIAPDDRIVVVTTRAHRDAVDECLAPFPHVRRIEQPLNRDTTPGILHPVLAIAEEDPTARVVILPSDHHVTDVDEFMDTIQEAADSLMDNPDPVLLLGAPAGEVDEGYGWIVPSDAPEPGWPRVVGFMEKPSPEDTRRLVGAGALRNTFVMVGEADSFLALIHTFAPDWYVALRAAGGDPERIDHAFRVSPPSNFSHEVLARAADHLRVVPLSDVGWDDIGTPDRLSRALELGRRPVAAARPTMSSFVPRSAPSP